MNRRDILKQSTLFAGAALSTGTIAALLSGCQTETTSIKQAGNVPLSTDQMTLLAEVTERIIPQTDTPGAKDAKVSDFINRALTNTFTDEEAHDFKAGLSIFDTMANEKFGKGFAGLNSKQMDETLTAVISDFKTIKEGESHIWPALKGLAITGFFTSEIAAKVVLKYDPIPGEWKGCVDMEEVGGLWAI